MTNCMPIDTPMDPKKVGRQVKVIVTRPKIGFPVNDVSEYLNSPYESIEYSLFILFNIENLFIEKKLFYKH